ncbi:MAG: hypothetical protein WC763_01560 [Candidatus Paceibacterota bacterium]|jgi:hypothetical protein
MKTTITSGQLANFLQLLEQHKMTPERFQDILEVGIFPAIFDPAAHVKGNHHAVVGIERGLLTRLELKGIEGGEAHLIKFGKMMHRPEEMIEKLGKMGLRPANRFEVEMFRKEQPLAARRGPIFGYDGDESDVPGIGLQNDAQSFIWDRDMTEQYLVLAVSTV